MSRLWITDWLTWESKAVFCLSRIRNKAINYIYASLRNIRLSQVAAVSYIDLVFGAMICKNESRICWSMTFFLIQKLVVVWRGWPTRLPPSDAHSYDNLGQFSIPQWSPSQGSPIQTALWSPPQLTTTTSQHHHLTTSPPHHLTTTPHLLPKSPPHHY